MEFITELQKKSAKRSFLKNQEKRKILFEKYQILLENGLTYKDITDKMISRAKSKTPQVFFLEHLREELAEGHQFSDALEGWATTNEIMIIASGEASGEISNAFKQCANLMGKIIEMRKTIKAASIYPSILLIALFGIIYAFANFMLPILEEFSEPDNWPASAQKLGAFSSWISDNIVFVIGFIGVMFWIVGKSLPTLRGRFRNNILDKIPPYNLYREIQSGLFLSALATLLKSDMTFSKSLEFIENESTPYVKDKIYEIIENTNEGKNEGEAINIDFVGEVGNDIEDFAIGSDIGTAMESLGDKLVQDKIEKIKTSSGALKFIAMILVFLYVLWAYGSFVSITQNLDIN